MMMNVKTQIEKASANKWTLFVISSNICQQIPSSTLTACSHSVLISRALLYFLLLVVCC